MENPRYVALLALREYNKGELFADAILNSTLNEYTLSERDGRLVTELFYGTVRMVRTIDFFIDQVSVRPVQSLETDVANILRLGVYQLFFLDRIPPSAAINESVKLGHRVGHKGIAGFINGVLRNLLRKHKDISFPSVEQSPVTSIGVRYSFPDWLVKRMIDLWGTNGAEEFCRECNSPPELSIRVNSLKTDLETLEAEFSQRGFQVTKGRFAPDVLTIQGFLSLAKDRIFAEGNYYVQNESSVLVGYALGVHPGELVFDLCSAPGGKSTHLAQLMNNHGKIVSFDVSEERLNLVQENARRLGISIISTRIADAEKKISVDSKADRVLVDAPCSGLGVIRHKPDIRWKKDEQEIRDLANIQRRILSSAEELVKPGGTLVYSTCTWTPEENGDVVDWFLRTYPGFTIASLPKWFPDSTERAPVQILPHVHGIDGFYVCCLQKST